MKKLLKIAIQSILIASIFMLSVSVNAITLNKREKNKNDLIFEKIENSIYVQKFNNCNILVENSYNYGNSDSENFYKATINKIQKINLDNSNLLYNNDETKSFAILNKNEIFDLYTLRNKNFSDNIKKVYDGNIQIHTIAESEKIDNDFGTALHMNNKKKLYCRVYLNFEKKQINIATFSSILIDKSIKEILKYPQVREQLEQSNLNLEKTKMLVLSDFEEYDHEWGLLFYDEEFEYFMPLTSVEYYPVYLETDYLLPSELTKINWKELKLYDVRKDIMPIVIEQKKMETVAVNRAIEDNYKKYENVNFSALGQN